MKISRTVSYAIQATIQLAQAETKSPTPCSQLAAEGDMPERFLLQILRNLVTHGVLDSTRGVEGGYRLARDPQDISLLEIIEAIEGPLKPGVVPRRGLPPEVETRLRAALEDATEHFREKLDRIKLSDLVGANGKQASPPEVAAPPSDNGPSEPTPTADPS